MPNLLEVLTDRDGVPLLVTLGGGGWGQLEGLVPEIDPPNEMLDTILSAVVTDVSGLNLSLTYTTASGTTTQTATVVKRKGVKREPGVDQPFQITVCKADEPEQQTYMAFGKQTTRWLLEITIVAPNQKDWLTNLPQYATMREQIRGLFLPPSLSTSNLATTTGVFDVRVEPSMFLNRDQMDRLYDDQTIYLRVRTTP